MKVAVLTIGNEILSGDTINTNSNFICKEIALQSCTVISELTVADNSDGICNGIDFLINTGANLIISTGGLGPTSDDITRKTIFKYFNTEYKFDDQYYNHLKIRFNQMGRILPESNRGQAYVPINGDIFPNPIGSARGLRFTRSNYTLMALPGVPSEMKVMVLNTIIPWIIKNKSSKKIYPALIRTTGEGESNLIENHGDVFNSNHKCSIGYYPSLYGVDIRFSSSKKGDMEKLKKSLLSSLGDKVYAQEKIDIEEVVISKFRKKKLTISTAESCTGGLIGHRLTQVSGSSNVYLGGIIAYSNVSKIENLYVEESVLEKFGAVSEKVALQMANGVRKRFKTSIGISTTGIAGPVLDDSSKTVGLVYIAISTKNKQFVTKMQYGINRKANKIRTSQSALNFLRKIRL